MAGDRLVYDDKRSALFQDGKLVEYICDMPAEALHIGAICHARITQIFPKQKRANCQLADGQMASLRLDGKSKALAGDLIWVTLSAMPRQQKPWQAEQGISRAGHLIVLHCGKTEVRSSHKSKDEITPDFLAAIAKALPAGWGGVLKRNAQQASLQDVLDEIDKLLAPLAPISESLADIAAGKAVPSLVGKTGVLYHGDLGKLLLTLAAPTAELVYDSDAITWDEIDYQAEQASKTNVILDNGAELSIEPTKALIAVDVDSAASKLAPLALAKFAAPEIMRLIRLASYSGVIVIDMPRLAFRDMAPILDEMRRLSFYDSRHPDVLGLSRAGLIELVVRHRLAPLSSRLHAQDGIAR